MQIIKKESLYRVDYGYYQGDKFIKHREGKPALEWVDEYKIWYFHGEIHRENGPAIECANGNKYWYLEGKYIEEEDFEEALKIYKVSKLCK